jgi:hypothetical protein
LVPGLDTERTANGIELIEKDYERYSLNSRARAEFLTARQDLELEKFSDFINNVKKPKENPGRQKLIIRHSRQNF